MGTYVEKLEDSPKLTICSFGGTWEKSCQLFLPNLRNKVRVGEITHKISSKMEVYISDMMMPTMNFIVGGQ